MSRKGKQNNNKCCLLQANSCHYKKKKSIWMARRMVFGAQDASEIVDLDHLVVLISTTTTDIDRERVLIDDLWGSISDLRRLVSWRHKLRKKVSEEGL